MRKVDKQTLDDQGELSASENETLLNGYQSKHPDATYQLLLSSIRKDGSYLKCKCMDSTPTGPIMGTRMVGDALFLVNLRGRRPHVAGCPFEYSQGEHAGATRIEKYTLVEKDASGRIAISPEVLDSIYPKLISACRKNTISALDDDDFFDGLLDAARLTPLLAKNGAGGKIRFGVNSAKEIKTELKESEDGDFRILISLVGGFDEYSIYTYGQNKNRFTIDAGIVNYTGVTSTGPFVATTLYSKKGNSVFPVRTAIKPCLSYKQPIPVRSSEQREIIRDLIRAGGSLDSIKKPIELTIPVEEVVAPISDKSLMPILLVTDGEVTCVIGSPLKGSYEYYNELGNLVWHRHFNCIPAIRDKEKLELYEKIRLVISGNS